MTPEPTPVVGDHSQNASEPTNVSAETAWENAHRLGELTNPLDVADPAEWGPLH